MESRSIANKLAEHAPVLGSVTSHPGLAAYGGAGPADFVRPAGSLGPALASANTAQWNSLPQKFFSMSKSTLFTALAGYAAAEPLLQFTLMKLSRLTVSLIASLLRSEAVQFGVTAEISGSLDSRR
jgi:hypothetical protein